MQNKKTVLIGIGIIALAIAIVLAVIFVPRALYKSQMKTVLERACELDAQYVCLSDPRYDSGSVFVGNGKEIVLQGDALAQTLEALGALSQSFSYAKSEKGIFGMDLTLRVKCADGETVHVYFTDTQFYFCSGDAAHRFAAKDAAAYSAFLTMLRATLESTE
jgi:hypothetical protein